VPFLVRSVTAPLHTLRARLQDIAGGEADLTARLDEQGRDEFSAVALSFNHVVAHLAAIQTDSEGAVDAMGRVSGRYRVVASTPGVSAATSGTGTRSLGSAAEQVRGVAPAWRAVWMVAPLTTVTLS